jgi:hypothetical protein
MIEQRRARMAAQLRSHRGPPPGAEDRVLAAIQARLGGPPDGGASAPPSGGDLGYFAKIAVATASLTAGGLVAIRLVAVGVHAWRDDPVPAADPVVVVELKEAVAEPPPPPLDSPPPPEPDELAPDEAPKARPRSVLAPTSEASIAAELDLLRRARGAPSPAEVISLLETHAARFPRGSLVDERDALWSIASCEQGQLAEARARALELARRRPHSPLLERVAKRCPALAADLLPHENSGTRP